VESFGNDRLLSPEELSGWLKIPVSTIYGWRVKGVGPKGIRIGRHVRFRASDVEAYLEKQAKQS
jgi:excisionase family DNA binding protein